MISFRFHVVSITAVFLAIAIGVVVGSTYVDGLTVDRLENRIETVEGRVDRRARGERPARGRARDRPRVHRPQRRVRRDRPAHRRARRSWWRRAGSTRRRSSAPWCWLAGPAALVPGIVWLEPRWASDGRGGPRGARRDRRRLGHRLARRTCGPMAWEDVTDELAADAGGPAGRRRRRRRLDPRRSSRRPGSSPSTPSTTTTVGLADLVGAGPRMLIVTGARAEEELAPVIPVAVEAQRRRRARDGRRPTSTSSPPEAPGPGRRPHRVARRVAARRDRDRRRRSTSSPGGWRPCWRSTRAADGEVGRHYGYGEGADAVLPAWTPP